MKPITIYWAPTCHSDEVWNFPYQDPTPVMNTVFQQNKKDTNIFLCPAFRDTVKNLYSFNSVFDEYTELQPEVLEHLYHEQDILTEIPTDLKISLIKNRKSSLQNSLNIKYNLSWILFADEPVIARFTAPYLPPTTPSPQAILSPGQYDIGSWYRSFNLEYLVPTSATHWQYKENEPLFYLQVETDRKIQFKRYERTDKLIDIENEMTQSVYRYGFGIPMLKRYSMFHQSKTRQLILKEIKNNILE